RLVDGRREEFGQRAAGRFLPDRTACEVDVGVHGKTHPWQHQFLRQDLLAIEADRLGQTQPGFDTALLSRSAIVIDDALNPLAARVTIRTVGHDRRVLYWNADLIVETVRDPALDLLACRAAFIHGAVEGVMDMVVVALGTQGLLERGRGHG